ncbi:MAG: chromophore lyase CpcT/CpeT [Phycisphaerales bacterium]|nr:chromophore lyase CpcT/CpeT [Planctomycetota bacterium]MCH8509648.1 chromophore lyase CpcT/CpeT [Phycisphaerales bacterium]
MIRAVLPLLALVLASCAGPAWRADGAPTQDRLLSLRSFMTGSFSSAAQAARDQAYYDIVLHTTPMWTWRDDGPWLYVEQALAETTDRPYRQRVYKLERTDDGRFWSRVFVLPDPERHAGAWRSGSPLSELTPGDLEERVGCAVTLRWDEQAGAFVGSTTGTGCPSDLSGAAYATSQIVLRPDGMSTWDRGFDATGQQVWGATAGGYQFDRID